MAASSLVHSVGRPSSARTIIIILIKHVQLNCLRIPGPSHRIIIKVIIIIMMNYYGPRRMMLVYAGMNVSRRPTVRPRNHQLDLTLWDERVRPVAIRWPLSVSLPPTSLNMFLRMLNSQTDCDCCACEWPSSCAVLDILPCPASHTWLPRYYRYRFASLLSIFAVHIASWFLSMSVRPSYVWWLATRTGTEPARELFLLLLLLFGVC